MEIVIMMFNWFYQLECKKDMRIPVSFYEFTRFHRVTQISLCSAILRKDDIKKVNKILIELYS